MRESLDFCPHNWVKIFTTGRGNNSTTPKLHELNRQAIQYLF